MAKKNRKPIYIFILALILLYVVIYIIPKVTGVFETTETLEAGALQVKEDVTCYFVRDESVYESVGAGSLNYLIDEGTHIRKGTKVVKLTEDQTKKQTTGGADQESDKEKTGEQETSQYKDIITRLSDNAVRTSTCQALASGVTSYFVDGYESYFSPQTMDKLKYEDVRDLKIKAVDTKRKSTLEKEPIFKICDNDNWYLVCWVEAASVAKYETGNTVTVELPAGDVEATVREITEDGDRWRVIFRSNRFYPDFAKSRIEQAVIVSRDYNGLIARSSSITTRDGIPGVMVRGTSGEYTFTPVKVIASDGEYSVLADVSFTDADGTSVNTVKVYDEILKRPGKGT